LYALGLLTQQALSLFGFGFELGPQRGNLRFQGLAPAFDGALLPVKLLLLPLGDDLLLGLLRGAGRARQHPARPNIDFDQLDAVVGQAKLPELVGVRHATRLEQE
jgi:hypothetical protein